MHVVEARDNIAREDIVEYTRAVVEHDIEDDIDPTGVRLLDQFRQLAFGGSALL